MDQHQYTGSDPHGSITSRTLGLVIEWASMHRDELLRDWELARKQKKPEKIPPLK
jgi:hypothetical protein